MFRLFSVLAVCTAMLFAGCSNGNGDGNDGQPKTYTVSVSAIGNGETSANKTTAAEGETITLTADPADGYSFTGWLTEGLILLPNATAANVMFTMPAKNVIVMAEFILIEYSVSVTSGSNGTAKADKENAAPGQIITLTATPDPGYGFVKWIVESGSITLTDPAANPSTFTMPDGNVSIKAEFVNHYTVTTTSGGNGTAVSDKESAAEGATVELTATPDPGCEFVKWTVESGGVTLSSSTTATATFTMPAVNVSIKAEFIVRGVLINGVIWALCNVNTPDTFAANPEIVGMFYQWNRKIGWSTSNPIKNSDGGATWNSTGAEGNEWEAINDPCPAGWRVPSIKEFEALCDENKTIITQEAINAKNGRRFTDRESENSVFLPTTGMRLYVSGDLSVDNVNTHGLYWSASTFSETSLNGDYMLLGGSISRSTGSRAAGFAVRCVAK